MGPTSGPETRFHAFSNEILTGIASRKGPTNGVSGFWAFEKFGFLRLQKFGVSGFWVLGAGIAWLSKS